MSLAEAFDNSRLISIPKVNVPVSAKLHLGRLYYTRKRRTDYINIFQKLMCPVVKMATKSPKETTPAFFVSQQATGDLFADFEDACEIVITTIPRDGSLTKDDILERHQALANEFRSRLIEVANKSAKLKLLASFANNINNNASTEMGSDEQNSQTEEHKVFYEGNESSRYSSNDINEYDEAGKIAENELCSCNLLILENDTRWLRVPFLAVEKNDYEVLEMCIKTGVELEKFRNLKGQTLLVHAVEQPKLNYGIINILLKCIGVNIGSSNGDTAVMTCIQNDKISVKERLRLLETLIDAGANVTTRSFHLETTLHEFIFSLALEMDVTKLTEWKRVIEILLSKGIDINAVDFFGHSALICAITIVPPTGFEDYDGYDLESKSRILNARQCKIEIVEYLLQNGANVEVITNRGYTPLCVALANQNVEIVHTLIKHGANVNHLTNVKMSPAYVFCSEGDWSDEDDIQFLFFPLLQALLDANLDINIKGIDDSTVLHFAAANMRHTICEFLVRSGANIEANDYLQRKPLHMAIRNKQIMVIETLIKLGADIEAKDIHGDTPLTHACLHRNINAVKVLVEHGADSKVCGDLGIQPMHIAAENGDSEMMEILQNTGCDLTTTDASRSTPLHYAASDGNRDTVQYLLSQNISKKSMDSKGLIPLDLALLRGEYVVSTFLADSDAAVKFGKLPPGLFPNRPLRKMHELDNYMAEIAESLKSVGDSGVDIGKAILDTPGLGRLHVEQGESNQIYKCIEHLCFEIVERIGQLDPIFECKLMNAGSSFEGVKVGYPNEFDFACHLEKLSALVEKVEDVNVPEYCTIVMKDSLPSEVSRFCLRSNKTLNAGAVLRHFCRLTRIATYEVLKRKHQNIYSGFVLLNECAVIFDDSPIPLKQLQGFTVSWRGPTYKHIDVSVDINPVLYTTEWPLKAVSSIALFPKLQKEGMYMIPKFCVKNIVTGVLEAVNPETDLWRYSTHHVEAIIMKTLPQEARDSYMLCKAFRLEPLTCSIQVNKYDGCSSHTALKTICTIGEQEELYENDGNEENVTENTSESDENDPDIKVNELLKKADNEYMIEFVNNDIVKCDDECDLENERRLRAICDNSFSAKDTSDTDTVSIISDDNEDTYEMTAEKCIPSYHLKSLFLQEAEAIFAESGTFSSDQLRAIPYKVYNRLKTAVETQHLSTIFFPGENIYRQPQDDENLAASIKLRVSYINSILLLMRELGIGL